MEKKITKVLYMSYDGMTDPLGQSQVLPYLAGLSKLNFQYTLISFEKPDRFQQHGELLQELCKNANINWIPLNYTKTPPVISTIKDIFHLRKIAFEAHRKEGFDIVHCRSYITAIIGEEMKHKFGLKFLFDMRGFYADERVEGGIWNLKNPVHHLIYKFFKRKEKIFFTEAHHSISLTYKGKAVIQSWDLPNQPIPITVIPCCADLELFNYKSIDSNRLIAIRKKLGIQESDFVLHYLGSVGTWYMLPEMLRFFKALLKYKPEAIFLFTSGDSKDKILRKAEQFGIPRNKIVVQRADRQDVPYHIALANVGIFFIKPVFSKMASSPTKQGEMMGMGLPIICNDNVGDTGTIISTSDTGIALKRFDEETLNQTAQKIDQYCQIPKGKIREVAKEHYSLKKGVETYAKVYDKILS